MTEADLRGLIASAVRESRSIEYKRELPGASDNDKKEMLADVSSFANSVGGDLLYGVEATDGVPTGLIGLVGINEDQELLRLESSIRDGLDPRIPGIRLKFVHVTGCGPILLVRIPKSWAAPHMVTFKGHSRFFTRTGAGKVQMDTDELRSAFAMASDLAERIRAWRDNRVSSILSGHTPLPVMPGAKVVLHVVPLSSMGRPVLLSVQALKSQFLELWPLGDGVQGGRINLDGFLTHAPAEVGQPRLERAYCQVFRSGQIESVSSSLVQRVRGHDVIMSLQYEKNLLESTSRYLRVLVGLGVQYPMLIMATLLGVRGSTMGVDRSYMADRYPIDRDILTLPDVLLDEAPKDLPQAMRPIFDAVWNACGIAESANFGANGKWNAGQLWEVPQDNA